MLLLLFNFWFKLPEKLRFLLVGGWNTVFSILVFAFILRFVTDYQVALALSYVISVFQNFVVFRIFVFSSSLFEKRGRFFKGIIKINFVYLLYFFLNSFLLKFFVSNLGVEVLKSQIIITCILTILSYTLNKYFTFKR